MEGLILLGIVLFVMLIVSSWNPGWVPESVRAGPLELRVLRVEHSDGTGRRYRPADGYEFLFIQVRVEHKVKIGFDYLPRGVGSYFYVRTPRGWVSNDPVLVALLGRQPLLSSIDPGKKYEGWLVFHVPQNKPDMWLRWGIQAGHYQRQVVLPLERVERMAQTAR